MNFFVQKEITEKDLQSLNKFLTADHKDAKPLSLTQTHGFLCAIASSPCLIMPSKYQPVMLGGYPEFQSMEQANEILSIIHNFYNSINSSLRKSVNITPLIWDNIGLVAYNDAPIKMVEKWCEGYLLAASLDPTWSAARHTDKKVIALLAPFIILTKEDTVLANEPDENGQPIDISAISNYKQSLKKELPRIVNEIFEYWQEARKNPKCIRGEAPPPEIHKEVVQRIPKTGRNEPCICGSGIKFKKCCGSHDRKLH